MSRLGRQELLATESRTSTLLIGAEKKLRWQRKRCLAWPHGSKGEVWSGEIAELLTTESAQQLTLSIKTAFNQASVQVDVFNISRSH